MEEKVHILAEYHKCEHQRDLAVASEAELTKATKAEQDAILAATQLENEAAAKKPDETKCIEILVAARMEIDFAEYAQSLEIVDAALMQPEEKATEEQDTT
eukprot:scaffold2079_cov66-Cyclotella_meneghiniana.AAC.2